MKSISIPLDLGFVDSDGNPMDSIDGLERLNFFIGSTGSGKSRLLRHLSSIEDPKVVIGGQHSNGLIPQLASLQEKIESAIPIAIEYDRIWSSKRRPGAPPHLERSLERLLEILNVETHVKADGRGGVNSAHAIVHFLKSYGRAFDVVPLIPPKDLPTPIELIAIQKEIDNLLASHDGKMEYGFTAYMHRNARVFIPSLRFIEKSTSKDRYELGTIEELTKSRYFSDLPEGLSSPNIWSGGRISQEILFLKDPANKKVENLAEYEQFLSAEVFGGAKVKMDCDDSTGAVYVSIDGQKREVHLHGDGLSHLIILTFRCYSQGLGVFFIDEPEIGLHPGLQRAFMQALQPLRTEVAQQYFVATHSSHLLDQALVDDDIAIFQFRRNHVGSQAISKIEWGNFELLNELGVRPSSSFLVNATIWVEGVTDRLFLSHLLTLLQKEKYDGIKYQEGVHFSFVEYGGANLPHWSFLDNSEAQIEVETLCGSGMLIMDTDGADWKKKRAKVLKGKLGDRLQLTCGRELENMVSAKQLDSFVKNINPAASGRARRSDFRNQALGDYIHGTYNVRGFAAQSGTLKTPLKLKLTKHICQENFLGRFPKEVQLMAESMLDFIKQQN